MGGGAAKFEKAIKDGKRTLSKHLETEARAFAKAKTPADKARALRALQVAAITFAAITDKPEEIAVVDAGEE